MDVISDTKTTHPTLHFCDCIFLHSSDIKPSVCASLCVCMFFHQLPTLSVWINDIFEIKWKLALNVKNCLVMHHSCIRQGHIHKCQRFISFYQKYQSFWGTGCYGIQSIIKAELRSTGGICDVLRMQALVWDLESSLLVLGLNQQHSSCFKLGLFFLPQSKHLSP